MALVTSQSTLPDFEYEHHTVILDNLDHGSDNTDFTIPLGKANISREGKDATIVTYSIMLQKSLEAANYLKDNFEIFLTSSSSVSG